MSGKKLYPRNAVLRIAVSDIEFAAIGKAAAADGATPSDWALRKLWNCNLGSTVALYFPDDDAKNVPRTERKGRGIMTQLTEELYEIADRYPYLPAAKRIVAACESGDWQVITRAANEAIQDPVFMRGSFRSVEILDWAKRANRLTLRAKAA